jgi:hypothetical protein
MQTEFSADRQDADVDESDDYDYGDRCDMWSNLHVKLNIRISCDKYVQADDVLPQCTQQDTDQLLNVINSETDK